MVIVSPLTSCGVSKQFYMAEKEEFSVEYEEVREAKGRQVVTYMKLEMETFYCVGNISSVNIS